MRKWESVVVLECPTVRDLLKNFHETVDFVITSETDGSDGMTPGVWYGIDEDDAIAASKAMFLKPCEAYNVLKRIASPDAAMIDAHEYHRWHLEILEPSPGHGWRLVRKRRMNGEPWDVDKSSDPWLCFDPKRPNKDTEAALTTAALESLAGDDDSDDFFGRFDAEILVALHKHLGRKMTADELETVSKILTDAGDLFAEAAKRVLQRAFREILERVNTDKYAGE